MRLQGGSPAEDGLSDDVPETPDFLASCDTESDDDSQYSGDSDDASQDEGSSSVGRAGISLRTVALAAIRCPGCTSANIMFTGLCRAEYHRMAAINAEAQTGINKRGYSFVTCKTASAKSSTSTKKLSQDEIRKALQKQCNDNHNCIGEFSEADVVAVRK